MWPEHVLQQFLIVKILIEVLIAGKIWPNSDIAQKEADTAIPKD